MVEIELIENQIALEKFAPEWDAFVRASSSSTPFHLPVWLIAWWKHFGSGRLLVIVFRSQAKVCAVVPLFLHQWNGRCQLTLIGTGVSDFLDPIIEPASCAPQVVAHLAEYLSEFEAWQICDWQDLAADSPLARLPGAVLGSSMPVAETLFAGTFDQFWATRSYDLKRNVRRYRERAEKAGELEFEIVDRCAGESMDALIQLHAQRWKSRGEAGMIETNHSEPFLRDVAAAMAKAGLMRFYQARFGGKIVALILGFLYRNTVFAYISAFDPEHEKLGLGRILLYEAFRDSFAAGIGAWNFLRGDEPYKRSWGAQVRQRARVTLERPPAP